MSASSSPSRNVLVHFKMGRVTVPKFLTHFFPPNRDRVTLSSLLNVRLSTIVDAFPSLDVAELESTELEKKRTRKSGIEIAITVSQLLT